MKKNYAAHFAKAIFLFCGIVFSCALFSQTQFGWIQKAGFPGAARHRASAAGVGSRGYEGLGHVNSVVDVLFDDWWEYDPGTDTWSQKANYPGGPRFHAATFVINNKIYVGTGRDINTNLHQDFWCFDPVSNQWSPVASFPGAPRRGAIAFSINGYGYVGTGSYYSDFYRYNPANDTWSPVAPMPGAGRISAVGFAINGKGYVTTGDDGGPTNDMWEYDPAFNSWTQKANLPGLPRMEAGGFVFDGKAYVGTGDDYSSGNNYQDFWCFDPSANSWIQVADFAGAARRYLTCFSLGNRAYAGLGTSGMNYADLWEFGSISGIEENSAASASLEIFPNPVSSSATFHFSSPLVHAKIIVSDINGKELRTMEDVNGESLLFRKENLSPGIYFCSLIIDNKMAAAKKIVIE